MSRTCRHISVAVQPRPGATDPDGVSRPDAVTGVTGSLAWVHVAPLAVGRPLGLGRGKRSPVPVDRG